MFDFVVQNLERVASGSAGVRLLLEAVDNPSPPITKDVAVSAASWALDSLEQEVSACAQTLKGHAQPANLTPEQLEQLTRSIAERERIANQIKERFGGE